MIGSAFWIAPEVILARRGERSGYNEKVDVWSLGCIASEMWVGGRPGSIAEVRFFLEPHFIHSYLLNLTL